MMPHLGQHIKCLLKNNIFVEGILEEWGNAGVQLKSLDKKSIILIMSTADIAMIKIMLDPAELKKIPSEKPSELKKEFKAVYEQPVAEPLRIKSLIELKKLLVEEEKQIIANKLRSHYFSEKKVKYGYPRFFAQSSTK